MGKLEVQPHRLHRSHATTIIARDHIALSNGRHSDRLRFDQRKIADRECCPDLVDISPGCLQEVVRAGSQPYSVTESSENVDNFAGECTDSTDREIGVVYGFDEVEICMRGGTFGRYALLRLPLPHLKDRIEAINLAIQCNWLVQ